MVSSIFSSFKLNIKSAWKKWIKEWKGKHEFVDRSLHHACPRISDVSVSAYAVSISKSCNIVTSHTSIPYSGQFPEQYQYYVGWFYWGFTSLQRYFSRIATWKQEITNLWKFKWRGRKSNPGPLALQAKSLTTRPPLLPNIMLNSSINTMMAFQGFHFMPCTNVITRLCSHWWLCIQLRQYTHIP